MAGSVGRFVIRSQSCTTMFPHCCVASFHWGALHLGKYPQLGFMDSVSLVSGVPQPVFPHINELMLFMPALDCLMVSTVKIYFRTAVLFPEQEEKDLL